MQENSKDTYRTIIGPAMGEIFKDRGSKFIGFTFPIQHEDEVKAHLETLKKNYHTARHWCYAWQLGTTKVRYRVNDDGEPSNSAGQPIYGQIQSFDVTNVLVVVIRYFGGTKLGVGGLINAYRTGALLALEASEVIEKTIDVVFEISFDYPLMNTVMRIVKEHQLRIQEQELHLTCKYIIPVRKGEANRIAALFENVYGVSIKTIE